MAWSGSVTNRGTASSTGSSSADIAAFTGTADSLICLLVATGNEDNILASNISGHDDGGAWVEIATITGVTDTNQLKLFAAHEGSSPANEALIVNVDDSYVWTIAVQAFEITGVKVDGTVAESFGAVGAGNVDEVYPGYTLSMTTAAHDNSEGITIIGGSTWGGGATHTCTGYTLAQSDPGSYTTLSFAYISGEDTAQDLSVTQYTQHLGLMVEVVGASAAGGSSFNGLSLLGVS